MKGWWFRHRSKQILEELHPGSSFAFSDCWFQAFKRRFRISLRRATNTCQKEPSDKRLSVQHFHRRIRSAASKGTQVGPLGKWSEHQIANMDQTPLPFTFADGETYADKGDRSVWVRGGASGWDKRQATVQLTVFADGVARVRPLLIFRGLGMIDLRS